MFSQFRLALGPGEQAGGVAAAAGGEERGQVVDGEVAALGQRRDLAEAESGHDPAELAVPGRDETVALGALDLVHEPDESRGRQVWA
jgi:hypothetical protein